MHIVFSPASVIICTFVLVKQVKRVSKGAPVHMHIVFSTPVAQRVLPNLVALTIAHTARVPGAHARIVHERIGHRAPVGVQSVRSAVIPFRIYPGSVIRAGTSVRTVRSTAFRRRRRQKWCCTRVAKAHTDACVTQQEIAPVISTSAEPKGADGQNPNAWVFLCVYVSS
jgi:hypothetical protein